MNEDDEVARQGPHDRSQHGGQRIHLERTHEDVETHEQRKDQPRIGAQYAQRLAERQHILQVLQRLGRGIRGTDLIHRHTAKERVRPVGGLVASLYV